MENPNQRAGEVKIQRKAGQQRCENDENHNRISTQKPRKEKRQEKAEQTIDGMWKANDRLR